MDNYVVIEIQTSENGTVATLTTVCESYSIAQQKYHMILAAAAVSALPQHSAAILDPRGDLVASQCFDHPHILESEEETEPEQTT